MPSWIKKTSDITVDISSIKLIKTGSFFYLYSVFSGTFFEIDEYAFLLLNTMQTKRENAHNSIHRLKGRADNGLTEAAAGELEELAKLGVFSVLKKEYSRRSGLTTMNLDITRNCNLGCKYCFAGTPINNTGNKPMDFETAKSALHYLAKHSASHPNRLNVVFFGGEPLLYFPLLKKIVKYAGTIKVEYGKDITFDIFTNGTILNKETVTFIKEKGLRILLSIDGPKQFHDKLRPLKNKDASTYDAIMQHVDEILQVDPGKIVIRSTLTKENLCVTDTIETLAQKGFKNFVFEMVVTDNRDLLKYEEECSIFEGVIEKLAQNFRGLVLRGIKVNLLSEPIKKILSPQDIPPELCRSTCPAGRQFIIVSPEGDIYPCHYFADRKHWKMGTIFDGKSQLFSMVDENKIADLNKGKICGDCWMRGHICGGQCPFKSLEINRQKGLFDKNHCYKEETKNIVSLKVLKGLYPNRNYPFISTWRKNAGYLF